jgi:hypothetical protein
VVKVNVTDFNYVTPVDGGNASEMPAKLTISMQTSVRVDPFDSPPRQLKYPDSLQKPLLATNSSSRHILTDVT